MKKFFTYLLAIFLLVLLLAVNSFYAIKKPAPVVYIPWLPGSIMAQTIPPIGIFIESKYKNEGDAPGTILAHERVHWMQYQERGLWGYYRDYIIGFMKDGRLYNEMEQDARARSN